jgi:hypothetical protein
MPESPRILVFDNFYDDPDEIREIALQQEFRRKPGATYPGEEAIVASRDWMPVWQRMRSKIDEPCDAPCPKATPFPQGKFRLALGSDEESRIDRVHVDQQRWSGIVYLTLPRDCRSGLVLYRNRHTGATEWDEDWFQSAYGHLYSLPPDEFRGGTLAFFKDPANFEEIGTIPMAYNRAILLMAQVFHGSGCGFGDKRTNGRLSQHFEFYA